MADNSEPQRENLPKEDSPSLAANISALMGEATLHKKSGDNAKAGSAYLHVLQFDPGHAEAHYNIGHLYIAEENLPKAVKSIQNAIHFKPDYLEAHMTLGALLRAEGKFEEADKYFRSAVQCRPDHAAAHYFLGLGLKDQQKPDEAVMSFLEATRLNPSYAQAHFSLGDALRALGKIDSAIESYRIAVRIQPNDIRSLLHLGAALLEQENDSEAIEKFREVIHLDPANHDAYFGLGMYRYGNSRLGGLGNLIMQGGKDLRLVGMNHIEHAILNGAAARPLALKTLAWFYISEQINPENKELPPENPLSRKKTRQNAIGLLLELENRYFKQPPPHPYFRGNKELAMMKALQFVLDKDYTKAGVEFKKVLEISDHLQNRGFKINPQLVQSVEAGIEFCELMLLQASDEKEKRSACAKVNEQKNFLNGGGSMVEYDSKKIRSELHAVFSEALERMTEKLHCEQT